MELQRYNINYVLAHGAEGRGCTLNSVACGGQESPPEPLEMELLATESYPCSCWELTLGPLGEHCMLLPAKSSLCQLTFTLMYLFSNVFMSS